MSHSTSIRRGALQGARSGGVDAAPTRRETSGVKPDATGTSFTDDGEASPCDAEQYVGFIAEDVPNLVATNDRKGLSSMDLVAVLTKVVQEQQRQIEELRMRIEKDER
ncbi:MAG: hypothetical protein HYT87_10195 [Nitrospirae bacterium]|nr:hypothetical protein [Nitrospirota bacterium]